MNTLSERYLDSNSPILAMARSCQSSTRCPGKPTASLILSLATNGPFPSIAPGFNSGIMGIMRYAGAVISAMLILRFHLFRPCSDVAFLARIVSLIAAGGEEHAGRMQQLADRENHQQQRNHGQMGIKNNA